MAVNHSGRLSMEGFLSKRASFSGVAPHRRLHGVATPT